jgi:glycine/D-amino acid oxidase-like deaminating enzyme
MSHALGHRLRDGQFPAPSEIRQTGVLIVGGGISGLSAAWKLANAAVDDFLVLEMESEPGGNSRAGQSPLIAYPWGAHYLPLPSRESKAVRELLAELGVLQGDPKQLNRPTTNDIFAPRRRNGSIAMACGTKVCCRSGALMPLSANSKTLP